MIAFWKFRSYIHRSSEFFRNTEHWSHCISINIWFFFSVTHIWWSMQLLWVMENVLNHGCTDRTQNLISRAWMVSCPLLHSSAHFSFPKPPTPNLAIECLVHFWKLLSPGINGPQWPQSCESVNGRASVQRSVPPWQNAQWQHLQILQNHCLVLKHPYSMQSNMVPKPDEI